MAKKVIAMMLVITAAVLAVMMTVVAVLPAGPCAEPNVEYILDVTELSLPDVSNNDDGDNTWSPAQIVRSFEMTDDEREVLARLVWNEAGTCGDDCQRAIVSVTINQYRAGYWGTSYMGILTNPNIYIGALYLDSAAPDARVYSNIDFVLGNGVTIPPDVFYFRAHYGWEKKWEGYETIYVVDDVYFGHFINGNH